MTGYHHLHQLGLHCTSYKYHDVGVTLVPAVALTLRTVSFFARPPMRQLRFTSVMCLISKGKHIITWQDEICHVYWQPLRLCVCVYLSAYHKKCVRICPLASVASFGDIIIIFS